MILDKWIIVGLECGVGVYCTLFNNLWVDRSVGGWFEKGAVDKIGKIGWEVGDRKLSCGCES